MNFFRQMTYSKAAVIGSGLFIALIILFNIPGNILSWDVFGYYLYLPMTFIYHDLGMKNIEVVNAIIAKYHSTATLYQAYQVDGKLWVDKYTMGMSIMYLPGFLIGHLFAWISGNEMDGFSKPYEYSILFIGFVYTIVGLVYLRKVLLRFFSEKVTFFVIVLIVLGTNYYHNAVFSNAMSHVYIFSLYCMLLYYTIRWHETFRLRFMAGMAITAGLAILSRPSEIVCLAIPALWGVIDWKTLLEKIKLLSVNWKQVLLFLVIIVLIGLPQLLYWKWITGKYLYMSYNNPGEGFEFAHPYIMQVLFSFRKGWYVYTPLMIFATFGFYYLYKLKKDIFWGLFIYFIFNIYIVSSWSCWWYADSFGQRALVQSVAVMALPFGFFLQRISSLRAYKLVFFVLMFVFFVFLNFFQTWQINHSVMATSRMTQAYYWKIFLKTKATDEDRKLLLVNRSYDGTENMPDASGFDHTSLAIYYYDDPNDADIKDRTDSAYSHSGKFSVRIDSSNNFSPSFSRSYRQLTDREYVWVKVSAYVYPVVDVKTDPVSLVITFMHKGFNYKYYTLDLEKQDLKTGEWNKISATYMTPEVRNPGDKLTVYFWHRGKKPFYIDDLTVDLYEPKESN